MWGLLRPQIAMNSEHDNENGEEVYDISDDAGLDLASVDDFIKQLEEKEKDLHITAETTLIEIAEIAEDEGDEIPEFLRRDLAETAAARPSPTRVSLEPALRMEIGELKGRVRKLEADRAEIVKVADRRSKDFEVFKARTERERRETFTNQVANLAGQMLPALDNLQRAIDFAEALPEEKLDELSDFFQGILLVNQQVNEILNGMGVAVIETTGRPFDPYLHEAVAIEETAAYADNEVCEEILRGYRMGDRIIRHSMVKVAKNAEGQKPEAANEPKGGANVLTELETFGEAAEAISVEGPKAAFSDEFELEIFHDNGEGI